MADENDRFEQFTIVSDADKVSEARETGILRDVQIMGFESRNGYHYDPAAIAANRTRFEGMAVGIDHDYKLGPLTLDNTWGSIREVTETGRRGNLHFNRAHGKTNEILEDISRGTRPVALSPVCANCKEETREGKRVVTAFEATRLDVVIHAATNKTMFNQAAAPTPDPRLEQALTELASLKAKVTKLETTAPAIVADDVQRMEQAIERRGVDLTQFHDDFAKGKIK